MTRITTHYDNLGVTRNAQIEVIKGAYKALAQKYHPDRYPDKAEADRIMKIINEAYRVLSDTVLRVEHDRWILEQEREELYQKTESTKTETTSNKPQYTNTAKTQDYSPHQIEKNFWSFEGRLTRRNYALFSIPTIVLMMGLQKIFIGLVDKEMLAIAIVVFVYLLTLGFLVFVSFKRIHDCNRTGWWLILPIVIPFYTWFASGTKGTNYFGTDPRQPNISYQKPKEEDESFWWVLAVLVLINLRIFYVPLENRLNHKTISPPTPITNSASSENTPPAPNNLVNTSTHTTINTSTQPIINNISNDKEINLSNMKNEYDKQIAILNQTWNQLAPNVKKSILAEQKASNEKRKYDCTISPKNTNPDVTLEKTATLACEIYWLRKRTEYLGTLINTHIPTESISVNSENPTVDNDLLTNKQAYESTIKELNQTWNKLPPHVKEYILSEQRNSNRQREAQCKKTAIALSGNDVQQESARFLCEISLIKERNIYLKSLINSSNVTIVTPNE